MRIVISVLIAFLVNASFSQKISTDPNNPINEERPAMVNGFNWMDRLHTVYHPNGGYDDGVGNAIQIGNPYFEREEYQSHFNLFNYELSLPASEEADQLYFHPKDGWELFHKHNGFEVDELTLITDPLLNRIGPYFILYNRYTAKLRVLASFDGIGSSEKIITTLKFKNASSAAPNLKYSGLLNSYGLTSQPLDQKTEVIKVAEASNASVNRGFISSDFQMSYDPCVCENQSELIFDFTKLDEADITLEGRLVGTTVPLNGSGNNPLLNRDDFLAQVFWDDEFSVNGGMLTYKNINDLVAKYKQPERSNIEKLSLDLFKNVIKSAASAVDKNLVNKKAAVGLNVLFPGINANEDKGVGLNIIAAGAKYLTAELFPEHKVPNISFIEAEMALTGTLSDKEPLNNGSINLPNPGSFGSEDVQEQFYPAYNKPLGLFALLETPQVVKSQNITPISRYYCQGIYEGEAKHNRYKLVDELKYTFNPIAEVNLENTKILGAFIIEVVERENDNLGDYTSLVHFKTNLGPIPNFESFVPEMSNRLHRNYTTPFIPIENLQDVIPEILTNAQLSHDSGSPGGGCNYPSYNPDIKVSLRILIEYEFEENTYGKRNKTLQVYTYPVSLTNGSAANNSFEDLESIPLEHSLYTAFDGNIQHGTELRIWDQINISKNVNLHANFQGDSYTMKAKSIHLTEGANIGPGITLKAGLPLEDRNEITPVSSSFVSNFCETSYKGNQYVFEAAMAMAQQQMSMSYQDSLSAGIVIYSNPNDGNFTVSFEEPATSCQQFQILKSSGEVIYDYLITDPSIAITVNISTQPNGTYFGKFLFPNNVITKQIIKE